ncbi:DUF4268 domain-containing protein [Virgibacillus dokdonensis]|uniref:DUF4268 domain-containing protein n=1 Tax=Virgibacillus dokdonensis TaxID=302167 RepID=UPI00098AA243|nr:DUF4268 domain-containing protein [Virgibacillus dokdonensis]
MSDNLGNLKKVNVRNIWSHEALEFTPWLANEENIAELGKALGLELEVEGTEVAVGPYSADILAKDAGSNDYIVIENQLEKTDHDHLGKAITYASVLDASAIIWIATNFTEEHKKALDWLNDHISNNISFYGVSLELWSIDDSKPAVRFNVVSQPTEIVKQTAISKSTESLTPAKKLQLEFWSNFREKLKNHPDIPSVQTARPQYWYDVSLGRSGINLSNIASTSSNQIGVRVYINNKIADSALSQLKMYKDDIESEIGEELQWNPNPENRDKIISLKRSANIEDKDKWNEYLDWLVDMTVKFRRAFSKRIKTMEFGTDIYDSEIE